MLRRGSKDKELKRKVSSAMNAMKWWSKCISMVINRTASRNVAFKVSESIMQSLGELIKHNT